MYPNKIAIILGQMLSFTLNNKLKCVMGQKKIEISAADSTLT